MIRGKLRLAVVLLLVGMVLPGAVQAAEPTPLQLEGGLVVHLYRDRVVPADDQGVIGTLRVLCAGREVRPEQIQTGRHGALLCVFDLDASEEATVVVSAVRGGGETGGWRRRIALERGSGRKAFLHLDGRLDFRAEDGVLRSQPFRGRMFAVAVSSSPELGRVLFVHSQYDGRLLENAMPECESGPGDKWLRLSSVRGPLQWRIFTVGVPKFVQADLVWTNGSARLEAFPYVPGRVVSGEGKPSVELRGRGGWAVRFLVPHVPALESMPVSSAITRARIVLDRKPLGGLADLDLPKDGANAAGFAPVVVDPGCPRYLARFGEESLQPFVPVGRNTAWQEEPLSQYPEVFRRLRLNGENTCRMWIASWHLPLAGREVPFDRARRNGLVWDYLLMRAGREGIRVVLALSCAHDAINRPGAIPGELHNGLPAVPEFWRYLRHSASRFWAFESVLYMEPMNEPDYAFREGPPGRAAGAAYEGWFRDWLGTALEAVRDPSGRPVSCGLSSLDAVLGCGDLLDVRQLHVYLPHTGEERLLADFSPAAKVAEAVRLAGGDDAPVLIGEFGYLPPGMDPHSPDAPANHQDPDGKALKDAIWASLVSGAAGSAWPWWWDTYIEKYGLGRRMKAAAKFLDRVDIRHLTGIPVPVAVPAGITAVCSRGNRGAAAYLCGAGVADKEGLRLVVPGLRPDMAYRIVFHNPEDGGRMDTESAVSDAAGRVMVNIPGPEECVLVTVSEEVPGFR